MRSQKRASKGNERAQNVMNVLVQDGSSGWSRAQLRLLMSGCAGSVMGAICARFDGSVCSLSGKRIGDTWGLMQSCQPYGRVKGHILEKTLTASSTLPFVQDYQQFVAYLAMKDWRETSWGECVYMPSSFS